jgi:hypothetical protein
MPIWAFLYLVVFLGLNVHGYWDKFRRDGFRWKLVFGFVSLVFLACLYVAYWYPWSLGRLDAIILFCYVLVLLESFVSLHQSAKSAARLDDIPESDWIDLLATYLTNLFMSWLVLAVICFPFLIIAGLAAVRICFS